MRFVFVLKSPNPLPYPKGEGRPSPRRSAITFSSSQLCSKDEVAHHSGVMQFIIFNKTQK